MNVNSIILEKLYNREFKDLFLEEYLTDDKSRESYAVVLIKIAKYEKNLKKDLCQFSKKEILGMFKKMKINSHTTMKTLFNICKTYSSWTCGKKINRDYNIPFSSIEFERDIFPLLVFEELKDKYITEKQLWEIIDNNSFNAQDIVCLLLPFYFIKGDKCVDMINLKIDNVNIDKLTITVGDREILMQKRVIDIIMNAYNQTIYNRFGEKGYGGRSTCTIVPSQFIIRPVAEKTDNEFVSAVTCANRCRKILHSVGIENMSINDINTSGKLHVLSEIKNREECVLVADYQDVNKMFGHNIKNYANIKKLFEIIYEDGEDRRIPMSQSYRKFMRK